MQLVAGCPPMGFGSYCSALGRRITTVLLSLGLLCSTAAISQASPTTPYVEITQAVQKTGAAKIETASANQVLQAFAAVLVTKKSRDFATYVAAAVQLRHDLAYKIVETALTILKLNTTNKGNLLKYADEIVVAAILADPSDADPIIRAALFVLPDAKDNIVAAATKAAPEQEYLILRAAGEGQTMAFLNPFPFGSINPRNQGGPEPVVTPEKPPGP